MALFNVAGDSQQDPGQRFYVDVDPATGEKIYFWVRRITQSEDQEIKKAHPGKWNKKLRMRIRSEVDNRTIDHEILRRALVRIDGPLFAPLNEQAAQLFSKATGMSLKVGENVYLNGNLNEETKQLLFDRIPVVEGFVERFFRELNEVAVQEEEEATENLSPGSSGDSTPTSLK
jgi:hypothetical protein